MRFLPILLLSAGLLLVVMMMAGDRDKGVQVVRNILLVIGGMMVLIAAFALISNARS